MSSKRFAPTIMFWLGVFYMTVVFCAMTPYTHSLDDIKVTLIHVLGPLLIAVYLVLAGLGHLEIPRRGTLGFLTAYAAALLVSAVFARRDCQWQSWLGVGMSFVLLGPFLAFFSCSVSAWRLKSVVRFFTALLLFSTLFGLAIHGWEVEVEENGRMVRDRKGLGALAKAPYQRKLDNLRESRDRILQQYQTLQASASAARTDTERAAVRARLGELQQSEAILRGRIIEIQNSPFYRLAATFDGPGGKTFIMSFVLNRQFYAAFLLLTLPMAFSVFLNSGGWLSQFRAAGSPKARIRAVFSWEAFWQVAAALAVVTGFFCALRTNCKITLFLGLEIIIAAFIILYFFVARQPERRRPLILALSGGLAILAGPLVFLMKGASILHHLRPDVFRNLLPDFWQPVISRQIIWGGAVDIWFSSVKTFLIGGGPMTFGILFPTFRRPDYFLYEISHRTLSAHNMFLNLLAEVGLVGFVSLMGLLAFLFWKTLRAVRLAPDPRNRVMAAGIVAGMTGFLIHNANAPSSQWPIGAIQLWAVLGVMAGMVNRPLQKDGSRAAWKAPTLSQRKAAWILCAVCLVAWVPVWIYGVRYFQSAAANNRGLIYVGDDSNPIAMGYAQAIDSLERAAAEPNLPAEERDRIQARVQALRDEYETMRQTGMAAFREAIRLNPFFLTSYYKLATLEFMGRGLQATREDYEKALVLYEKLQEYGPEYSQIRLNLGQTHMRLGNLEASLKHLRLAARMTIDLTANKLFIHQLWEAGARRKSPLLAEPDIEDVVALAAKLRRPKTPFSEYLRARLSEDTRRMADELGKNPSESRKNLLKSALVNDLNRVLQDPGMYNHQLFRRVHSAMTSQRILDFESESEDITVSLNRSLLSDEYPDEIAMNPYDEAILACERLINAWEEIREKNKPIDFNSRRRLDETMLDLAAYYSAAVAKGGTRRQRARALEFSWRLEPDNTRLRDELANFYASSGEFRTLKIFIEGEIEKDPANPILRIWLAKSEYLLGNLREAKRQVLSLEQIAPQIEDVPYLLYRIYASAGHQERAIEYAHRYLEIGKSQIWLEEAKGFLEKNESASETAPLREDP